MRMRRSVCSQYHVFNCLMSFEILLTPSSFELSQRHGCTVSKAPAGITHSPRLLPAAALLPPSRRKATNYRRFLSSCHASCLMKLKEPEFIRAFPVLHTSVMNEMLPHSNAFFSLSSFG
jgi:hypothetical protein